MPIGAASSCDLQAGTISATIYTGYNRGLVRKDQIFTVSNFVIFIPSHLLI